MGTWNGGWIPEFYIQAENAHNVCIFWLNIGTSSDFFWRMFVISYELWFTAITNQMNQRFRNDPFPTWAQQSEYDFNAIYLFTTANRYPVKVFIFTFCCQFCIYLIINGWFEGGFGHHHSTFCRAQVFSPRIPNIYTIPTFSNEFVRIMLYVFDSK